MSTVFLPDDVIKLSKSKKDATANEKGDTLVFGLLKLWERSFQKLVSYDENNYMSKHVYKFLENKK